MKKVFCLFLLLFNSLFLFAQSPYKQNIADLVSYTFPQKPAVQDTLDTSVAQLIDSLAVYSVLSRALSPDEGLAIQASKLTEYYESFVKGFVKATGGRLISQKPFKIGDFNGVDIEVITTANPDLPDLRFARILFLNNTSITANFMTWSENKAATQPARTQFFNSLTITADKTELAQGVENPKTYAIAYMFGKISGFVLLIGIVIGVVFLIKRITTRKKKKQQTDFS